MNCIVVTEPVEGTFTLIETRDPVPELAEGYGDAPPGAWEAEK